MASDKGPIVTEPPPAASTAPPTAALPSAEAYAKSAEALVSADAARPKPSAKRPRETTPSSPTSPGDPGFSGSDLSPSKIARLVGAAQRASPTPMTSAVVEDERRLRDEEAKATPENPAQSALAALSRATEAMSRTQDSAQPTDASHVDDVSPDAPRSPSPPPHETPSLAASADEKNEVGVEPATGAQHTASNGSAIVASPAPMEVDSRADRPTAPQPDAQMDGKQNISLSYPGVPSNVVASGGHMNAPPPPQRGMSMPTTTTQNPDLAPRSPSSKKHRCPYCETEFTRQHNLKSHLLTHSQEKPFICQTCQMRFRRLHDLKRHEKLHTGEKPHVCPKCDRKFARGDALARHNKGAGGCAGRRTSMGSFAGDDDFEGASVPNAEDSMTGVIYDGTNESDLADEERRHLGLPTAKANQHTANSSSDGFSQHARAYPPAGGVRPNNPSIGMTESPKPLSPPVMQAVPTAAEQTASAPQRNQGQHGQHGRTSDHQDSPNFTLVNYGVSPGGASGPNSNPISAGPSQSRSVGSGANGGSGDSSANLFASGDSGVWMYIQTLEEKMKQLTDRVSSMENAQSSREAHIGYLTNEVTSLQRQLEQRQPEAAPSQT